MCCFSGPVKEVANTRIFARYNGKGQQFLVYSMRYQATQPTAMILPLPVAVREADPVTFISLKNYPRFFRDMNHGFPVPPPPGAPRIATTAGSLSVSAPLPVIEVGDFIASYVPRMEDFDRLNPRFAIPKQTWQAIPGYRDYGFAVFKLKAAPQTQNVHPMALSFATRYRGTLFFPTVHIHDGRVHKEEHFDHLLYAQIPGDRPVPDLGEVSVGPARQFMKIAQTEGIVAGEKLCFKRTLFGNLPNSDTLVRL